MYCLILTVNDPKTNQSEKEGESVDRFEAEGGEAGLEKEDESATNSPKN